MDNLTLTDLPDELLMAIGQYIDHLPTFATYISTCKKIRNLSDDIVYNGKLWYVDWMDIQEHYLSSKPFTSFAIHGPHVIKCGRPDYRHYREIHSTHMYREYAKPFSHIETPPGTWYFSYDIYNNKKTLITNDIWGGKGVNFSELNGLKTLVLSMHKECNLQIDPEFINRFPHRDTLPYSHRTVTNVVISGLNSLEMLDLSEARVVSGMEYLSTLPKLHTLILGRLNIISLPHMPNIQTIDITASKVSDISALTNIHTLIMNGKQINDLTMMVNLKTLVICDGKLSDGLKINADVNVIYVSVRNLSCGHFLSYDSGKFFIPYVR
jgi:Leucine-rich repeat (LRR) protein